MSTLHLVAETVNAITAEMEKAHYGDDPRALIRHIEGLSKINFDEVQNAAHLKSHSACCLRN